jgi:predicted GH43/DUF377 family glycosyl hydrolase
MTASTQLRKAEYLGLLAEKGDDEQVKKILLATLVILVTAFAFVTARADANQWVRNPTNPVLSPSEGTWDSWQVLLPSLHYDGSTYHMWYSGRSQDANFRIGYASSSDSVHWTKRAEPVLTPGPTGSWDAATVSHCTVLKEGSVYMMWYRGFGLEGGGIGLATSSDGIAWSKHPNNPVMTPSKIDEKGLVYPWVIRVATEFKMWYSCRSATGPLKICLATSPDGVTWTKVSAVFAPSTTGWDAGAPYAPNVLFDGNAYGMWYSGCDKNGDKCQIGFATSKDGKSWTRAKGNPILGPSPPGSWDSYDSVDNQGILQIGNDFKLYYSADETDDKGNILQYRIGLAESPPAFAIPEFGSAFSIIMPVLLLTLTLITASKRTSNAKQKLSLAMVVVSE